MLQFSCAASVAATGGECVELQVTASRGNLPTTNWLHPSLPLSDSPTPSPNSAITSETKQGS